MKVYGPYQELLENAKKDGIEAIIIATPLHLHAPIAIAAMKQGLHVITEKLMAHDVGQCKEMARVADEQKRLPGDRPPAALQHQVLAGPGLDQARA